MNMKLLQMKNNDDLMNKKLKAINILSLLLSLIEFKEKRRIFYFLKNDSNSNNNRILSKLINIWIRNTKFSLKSIFIKWRGKIILEKLLKKKINERIKGKLLLSYAKPESCLTLQEAFLRWKTRASRKIVKPIIDR